MRKSLCPFLFILLVSIAGLFSSCSYDPALKLFEEAEGLLGEGEYTQALGAYTGLVDLYPDSPFAPQSRYKQALIYSRYLDDTTRAMNAYSMLLTIYPDSPEVLLARADRAEIYSSRGEHWKAVEEYQWLMDRSERTQKGRFQHLIAMQYMKLNDFKQARIELEELLIEVDPGTPFGPDAYFGIATSYYLEGRTQEAVDAFDTVIALFPDHPLSLEAGFGKAASLEEAGRLKEALGVLQGLEGRYPNAGTVRVKIEWIRKRLKQG